MRANFKPISTPRAKPRAKQEGRKDGWMGRWVEVTFYSGRLARITWTSW